MVVDRVVLFVVVVFVVVLFFVVFSLVVLFVVVLFVVVLVVVLLVVVLVVVFFVVVLGLVLDVALVVELGAGVVVRDVVFLPSRIKKVTFNLQGPGSRPKTTGTCSARECSLGAFLEGPNLLLLLGLLSWGRSEVADTIMSVWWKEPANLGFELWGEPHRLVLAVLDVVFVVDLLVLDSLVVDSGSYQTELTEQSIEGRRNLQSSTCQYLQDGELPREIFHKPLAVLFGAGYFKGTLKTFYKLSGAGYSSLHEAAQTSSLTCIRRKHTNTSRHLLWPWIGQRKTSTTLALFRGAVKLKIQTSDILS